MKTLILASAIGLSTLMLAGCVSEGPSYQGDGYTMRPRDNFDRDDRYDRARDRTDYSRYSRDRDPGRRDRNDDEPPHGSARRPARRRPPAAATIPAAKFPNTTPTAQVITAAADAAMARRTRPSGMLRPKQRRLHGRRCFGLTMGDSAKARQIP